MVARAIGAVPDKDVGAGICVFSFVSCVFACMFAVWCGIFESCLFIYICTP